MYIISLTGFHKIPKWDSTGCWCSSGGESEECLWPVWQTNPCQISSSVGSTYTIHTVASSMFPLHHMRWSVGGSGLLWIPRQNLLSPTLLWTHEATMQCLRWGMWYSLILLGHIQTQNPLLTTNTQMVVIKLYEFLVYSTLKKIDQSKLIRIQFIKRLFYVDSLLYVYINNVWALYKWSSKDVLSKACLFMFKSSIWIRCYN